MIVGFMSTCLNDKKLHYGAWNIKLNLETVKPMFVLYVGTLECEVTKHMWMNN